MKLFLILILYIIQGCIIQSKEMKNPPNIIFIFADDLGWNDVSFHGSPEIPTPNIDALAMSGITLNNYYGEPLCTPSRAALMSGRYPSRLGLQHLVILAGQRTGLPLNVTTLPQHFKNLGYDTHMVGKWHLGYPTSDYLPTNRGFDSFFGYLNGLIGYYDFTFYEMNAPLFWHGVDLYNGTTPITNFRGKYAPYVFADKAKDVIQKHDTKKPLFLYVSQLAVHVGNLYKQFEAPPKVVSKFKHIKDVNRRIHAAVMSTLDDTVGTIVQALDEKDMLKNSIVLFVSDNGGQSHVYNDAAGSNYPLRGCKITVWEGGIRVPALVWSPLLKLEQPRVSTQLMHVSDWLPTLYSAAGGDIKDLGHMDGVDMWKAFVDDTLSPRTHMLNNLDPVFGQYAFRKGDLKLLNGTSGQGYDSWYGPSGFEYDQPQSMYQWVFKNGSLVRDILKRNKWWNVKEPDDQLYDRARVTCDQPPPSSSSRCQPNVKPCLFNITADPCEYNDIADQHPEIVKNIMDVVKKYEEESVPPVTLYGDPLANPLCHGYIYKPWLDPGHITECDFDV